MRVTASAVLWFFFAAAGWAQGLKPVPANEYNAVPRYAPNKVSETVIRNVNGVEVSEVRIVDGPLPNLPASVDLSEFAPVPGFQTYQDCTAWATAYCCLTVQNSRIRGIKNPSDAVNLFSPQFVYPQINGGNDNGSWIFRENSGPKDSAIGLFLAKGCSSNQLSPYIPQTQNNNGFAVQPSNTSFVEAGNYPLYRHGRCETLDDIRYALVFGIPVVIAAYTEPAFDNFSGPGIFAWQGGKNGRHAMCIVGYDNAQQAFRVQNSWGTGWGDKGRFWVGYKEFLKLNTAQRDDGWCYEAYSIILNYRMATQLRSTLNPPDSFWFTPDGAVKRKSSNGVVAPAGSFRAVETTSFFMYGLTPGGEIQYFENGQWNEINSAPFPQGLGGGKVKAMAASGRFLYIVTELGNICGRVPGTLSSTGQPHWEKIPLPGGKAPVDIRLRDLSIYVEASDGTLYRRNPGVDWVLQ